ncbi:MAG: hypothetical protein ACXACU_15860 [Candidatus Hodarchaeales archaeon]|jgi:hypothetical protein
MNNHDKQTLMFMAMAVLIMIIFTLLASFANAHETNQFTHMTDRSGPIVGQQICSTGITVWMQDTDNDGTVDKCTGVIFAHDQIHIAPFRMKAILINDKLTIGCTCEVLDEGI